jgi:hypothetical protein
MAVRLTLMILTVQIGSPCLMVWIMSHACSPMGCFLTIPLLHRRRLPVYYSRDGIRFARRRRPQALPDPDRKLDRLPESLTAAHAEERPSRSQVGQERRLRHRRRAQTSGLGQYKIVLPQSYCAVARRAEDSWPREPRRPSSSKAGGSLLHHVHIWIHWSPEGSATEA